MTNILWGIGQLVNNSSATLISTIQKHIFKKESSNEDITITSETTTSQRQDSQGSKKINRIPKTQRDGKSSPSCSQKPPEAFQSKQIQVGPGLKKRRQLSTQWSESLNLTKRVSKATSVPKVNHSDCKVGTSNAILKKNAFTEIERFTVCEDHQRAIAALKTWPAVKKTLDAQKEPPNKVNLTQKLVVALKCLKLEKIQSIPRYRSPDMEVMKLYKSASVEETVKLSKLNNKTR